MEVFSPAGDTETRRPVIILAFGGGFVEGARTDEEILGVVREFAHRGWVAASIDYRIDTSGRDPLDANLDDVDIVILRAVHDMKAAVRFFRADAAGANTLGVRGDAIYVGGISAGGITAATTGALDANDSVSTAVAQWLAANGGLNGSSGTPGVSSTVQGVFSISGALTDSDWIDAGDAPIYAAHEEFDPVVACNASQMSESGVPFAGGCELVRVALERNVPAELYLVRGATTHVGFTDEQAEEALSGAAAFFAARFPG
jgi:acetyl esterase/lipase